MSNEALQREVDRICAQFDGADEKHIAALEGMIFQAAHERLYLEKLNEQALMCGLVKFHPEDATKQRTLPISAEIARHSAAYTNIMDKLMKHLAVKGENDDDELGEFE